MSSTWTKRLHPVEVTCGLQPGGQLLNHGELVPYFSSSRLALIRAIKKVMEGWPTTHSLSQERLPQKLCPGFPNSPFPLRPVATSHPSGTSSRKPHQARRFYGVIAISVLVGLAFNYAGFNAVKMLFWSAVLNGVLAPPLVILIVLLTSDPK